MPTRTSVNRLQLRCICAALIPLIAGCSKGDAPPRKDSVAALAGTPARAPVAALPGALTQALDSYSGEDFYKLVHSLTFTADSVKDRKCKNDPACDSSKPKKIKVGVAAVVSQDSLSGGTTPKFGVVYIRATNKGDAEEARYSMKAGKQFEFYMVILPDAAGGMTWRLEQLDTTVGARRHVAIGTGAFQGCGHAWAKGAYADFKTCASAAAVHDSVVKLGLLKALDDGSAPMWATCASGCSLAFAAYGASRPTGIISTRRSGAICNRLGILRDGPKRG